MYRSKFDSSSFGSVNVVIASAAHLVFYIFCVQMKIIMPDSSSIKKKVDHKHWTLLLQTVNICGPLQGNTNILLFCESMQCHLSERCSLTVSSQHDSTMNAKTTLHDDLASNCPTIVYYSGQSVAHPAHKAKTQRWFCYYYYYVGKFWQFSYGLLQTTAATLSADLLL